MFKFRLALALGKTVAELDATLSSSELTEWSAYFELEPFGTMRDNLHSAQLCALMANINRSKRQKAFEVGDFMYKDRDQQKHEKQGKFIAQLRALSHKG